MNNPNHNTDHITYRFSARAIEALRDLYIERLTTYVPYTLDEYHIHAHDRFMYNYLNALLNAKTKAYYNLRISERDAIAFLRTWHKTIIPQPFANYAVACLIETIDRAHKNAKPHQHQPP